MIVMSANYEMEKQTDMMLRSLASVGQIDDYVCTLILQEGEKIRNRHLSHCLVHHYRPDPKFKTPWTCSPRWRVDPLAEVCLLMDSDVLALKDCRPIISSCLETESACGVIAHSSPFQKSIVNPAPLSPHMSKINVGDYLQYWKFLYNAAGISFPTTLHLHTSHRRNVLATKEACLCPYYINHGVMAFPSKLMGEMSRVYYPLLHKVYDLLPNNYYAVQIACSLALDAISARRISLPVHFNFMPLDVSDPDLENAVFLHYANQRAEFRRAFSDESMIASPHSPMTRFIRQLNKKKVLQ